MPDRLLTVFLFAILTRRKNMRRTLFRILALPMPTRGLRNVIRRLGGTKVIKIDPHTTMQNIANAYFDLSKTPPACGILKYIQDANIKLLKAFDTFAQNHNIQYFMIGGAIVGKIRHNDCIPWDDDIDIGMDADNYEKFITEIEKFIPNKNFYAYFSSNVCKIIHTKTKAFIDILRYDFKQSPHCYDEQGHKMVTKMQNKFIRKMQSRKFLSVYVTDDMSETEIKQQYKKVRIDFEQIRKLQNKSFRPCGGYKTIVPLHADCKPSEFYSYDTIFPIEKSAFHGYVFPFPADCEMYATKCWGDIWSFPTDMFRTHAFTKDKSPHKLTNLRDFLAKTDQIIYTEFCNYRDKK